MGAETENAEQQEQELESQVESGGVTPEDVPVDDGGGDGKAKGAGGSLPSPAESFAADVMRIGLPNSAAAKEDGEEESEEEAGDSAGQAPAEPEDQEQAEGEGESEEEEAEDPEKKPGRSWDRERQRRDQEAANERKELRSEIETLKRELAEARKNPAPEKSEGAGKEKPGSVDVDALLEEAEKLNADSDAESIGKLVKGLVMAVRDREAGARTASELQEIRETVKRLTEKADAQERQAVQSQIKAETDATVAALEKKHGAHLRNPARERATAIFSEMGYDADKKLPDLPTWKAVMRAAYAEVAAEKGGPKKPAKPKTPQPSMSGGRTVATGKGIKAGSLSEVMSRMRKERGL